MKIVRLTVHRNKEQSCCPTNKHANKVKAHGKATVFQKGIIRTQTSLAGSQRDAHRAFLSAHWCDWNSQSEVTASSTVGKEKFEEI